MQAEAWDAPSPSGSQLPAWGSVLDGLLLTAGLSSHSREAHRLVWPRSGQVSTEEGPRAGPRWAQRGHREGAGGPGARAHPRRHFGDLCPGRQSQPRAQSRRGYREAGSQAAHPSPPRPCGSAAWGHIPGTSLPSSARLLAGGGGWGVTGPQLTPWRATDESGAGPTDPTDRCNALGGRGCGNIPPLPHATLYLGWVPAGSPPAQARGVWGKIVHPPGVVSDMLGSAALWLVLASRGGPERGRATQGTQYGLTVPA